MSDFRHPFLFNKIKILHTLRGVFVMGESKKQLSEEELAAKAEAEAETEEDQKVYKKRRWQHRLRMGRHYRMERFTIIFFTLCSIMLIFTGLGWNRSRIAQKEQIGTQSKYSTSVSFSLSDVTGDVVDVFRNTEGTRAYVLLQFADMSKLSLDANDYQIYMTGFNKSLRQEPTGSMMIYGSSGYVALEFYDERGLSNEIYDITIRNNSEVTNRAELTEEQLAEMEDASFGRFDQANLYVNVGAEDVVEMDVLDKTLDPVQLYYALVGRDNEDVLLDEIGALAGTLKQLHVEHDEYINRLGELGYSDIRKPVYMEGDTFDDDTGYLIPKYMVEGAHDIEYIGMRSTDGFITQVVDDPSMFRDYMAEKRAVQTLATELGDDNPEGLIQIQEVVRDDGYVLDIQNINASEATSSDLSVRDSINSLSGIWGQYLIVKRELQIDKMRDLLLLDAEIRTQNRVFSANVDENFITIY